MPRNIDVELQDNLVNTCMPGDDITVTGIFKVCIPKMKNLRKITLTKIFCFFLINFLFFRNTQMTVQKPKPPKEYNRVNLPCT